jgi:hypothetical protein
VDEVEGIGAIPAPWKTFFSYFEFLADRFAATFFTHGQVTVIDRPELDCDTATALVAAFVDMR